MFLSCLVLYMYIIATIWSQSCSHHYLQRNWVRYAVQLPFNNFEFHSWKNKIPGLSQPGNLKCFSKYKCALNPLDMIWAPFTCAKKSANNTRLWRWRNMTTLHLSFMWHKHYYGAPKVKMIYHRKTCSFLSLFAQIIFYLQIMIYTSSK